MRGKVIPTKHTGYWSYYTFIGDYPWVRVNYLNGIINGLMIQINDTTGDIKIKTYVIP